MVRGALAHSFWVQGPVLFAILGGSYQLPTLFKVDYSLVPFHSHRLHYSWSLIARADSASFRYIGR